MLMENWHKFRQLSAAERGLLLQAILLLPLVHAALFFLGYARLVRAMAWLLPLKRVPDGQSAAEVVQQAQEMARLVSIAAQHGFFQATCLRKSILVWGFLRRSGVQGQIRFGVQLNERQLAAHAWVEYQGFVVNDAPDVRDHFRTFSDVLPEHAVDL